VSWVLDVGGILAGVAAVLAAVWARQTKHQVSERNSGSTLRDSQDRQEITLAAVLDGVHSLGHQIGEVRTDMGRMDDRLTGEVQELRRRVSGA
jgi:hypothetical protein